MKPKVPQTPANQLVKAGSTKGPGFLTGITISRLYTVQSVEEHPIYCTVKILTKPST